jgi:hypothetical protein
VSAALCITHPGSQQPVPTGPVVVNKSDINDLTRYISEGAR